MNDGIDPIALKTGLQILRFVQVALKEISPFDEFLEAINKVVEGNRIESPAMQFLTAMGADIAGSAGNEYVHHGWSNSP